VNYVRSDIELDRIVEAYLVVHPGTSASRCKRELRRECHNQGERLAAGWRVTAAWKRCKKD
jgi:hypothetical protein